MSTRVLAEIPGNIWKIEVADGDRVAEGDVLIIMESMKMEIPVEAPTGGVCRLAVAQDQSVQEGDVLAHID
jgi:acetyl-CoA carboxylase biotin carboxyl carrier protein